MMTTGVTSFVPALVSPAFHLFAVRQAVAGSLAGYGATTPPPARPCQVVGGCQSPQRPVRAFPNERTHGRLRASI